MTATFRLGVATEGLRGGQGGTFQLVAGETTVALFADPDVELELPIDVELEDEANVELQPGIDIETGNT